MEDQKQQYSPQMQNVLALIRLGTDRYGLSTQVKHHIDQSLKGFLQQIGPSQAIAADPSQQQPLPAMSPQSVVWKQQPEHYRLKIKQFVQKKVPFAEIYPVIKGLIQVDPRVEALVYGIETAYMVASVSQLEAILMEHRERLQECWVKIHPAIRGGMLVKTLHSKLYPKLIKIASNCCSEGKMELVERVLVFRYGVEQHHRESYQLFVHHQQQLLSLCGQWGASFGISKARLLVLAAQSAMLASQNKDAFVILQQISPETPEYVEALQLIRLTQHKIDLLQQSQLVQSLKRHPHAGMQFQLIKKTLERGVQFPQSVEAMILVEWLKNPLPLLQKEPNLWRSFSELLVTYEYHLGSIPTLFKVYEMTATYWYGPGLNGALYAPLLNKPHLGQVYGCALFHLFLADPVGHCDYLWQSLQVFLVEPQLGFGRHFESLRLFGLTLLSQTSRTSAYEKALKVCCDVNVLAAADVMQFLSTHIKAPRWFYERLIQFLRKFHVDDLLCQVLKRAGMSDRFQNQELFEIAYTSAKMHDNDQAYRALGILATRKALSPQLEKLCHVSGEFKQSVPLLPLTQKKVDLALLQIPTLMQRFLRALMQVGPLLPQLLEQLTISPIKVKSLLFKRPSPQHQKYLPLFESFAFKPQICDYQVTVHGVLSDYQQLSPPGVNVFVASDFSDLLQYTAHLLGFNSFAYEIDKLRQMVDRLNYQESAPVFKHWSRKLNPEQQSAFIEIKHLVASIDQQQLVEESLFFLSQLTLLMLPAHSMGLKSLRQMQLDLKLLDRIEHFILGDSYSLYRKTQHSENSVDLPLVCLEQINEILQDYGIEVL